MRASTLTIGTESIQQKLQNSQSRQQGLEADQDQHDAADALGRSAVLIAEEGTYAHTDGRQQAGDAANQAGGGQAKLTPTAKASMLVATASGSIALAE